MISLYIICILDAHFLSEIGVGITGAKRVTESVVSTLTPRKTSILFYNDYPEHL